MVFEPRSANSLSSNLKEIHTSSDTTTAKSTRCLYFPISSWRAIFLGGTGQQHLLTWSSYLLLRLSSGQAWLNGSPSSFQLPLMGWRLFLGWCTTESLSPDRLALAHGVGVPHWERHIKETESGCIPLPSSTDCKTPKVEMLFRENISLSSPPHCMAQRFIWGWRKEKQALELITLNFPQSNCLYLQQSLRSPNLRACLKRVEVVVKGVW